MLKFIFQNYLKDEYNDINNEYNKIYDTEYENYSSIIPEKLSTNCNHSSNDDDYGFFVDLENINIEIVKVDKVRNNNICIQTKPILERDDDNNDASRL